MKCPECVAQLRTSSVFPLMTARTLIGFAPFYDEDGKYHVHDPNGDNRHFECSNGHRWTEYAKASCPTCKQDW